MIKNDGCVSRRFLEERKEGKSMKYVLVSLAEASKLDFSGAEKLTKTDHIVFLYVKDKKTVSAALKAKLEDVKCVIDYFEIASTSELTSYLSYFIGYHSGAKHDVIVITQDKSKIPSKIARDAKIYVSFKSVATASSAGKTGTSAAATSNKKKKASETKVENLMDSLAKGDTAKAKKQMMGLAEQFIKDKLK